MISVEEPEEGKKTPEETGVWKNRLRKRPQKELVSENPSKSIKRSQQNKVEASLHNNNLIHREIKISSKKPVKSKKKKENESMPGLIKNFHSEPKTIKQRMDNQSLLKAYNRDYEDDIFDSGQLKTVQLHLPRDIEGNDSASDSFSSSSSEFSSSLARSPLCSPVPRIKREDTPEYYRKFVQENQVNSEEASSFKHVAFLHKSLKNQKIKPIQRISTQVASVSKRLMKESLEASSREIASLSSLQPDQEEDESDQCEEYFSEENWGAGNEKSKLKLIELCCCRVGFSFMYFSKYFQINHVKSRVLVIKLLECPGMEDYRLRLPHSIV